MQTTPWKIHIRFFFLLWAWDRFAAGGQWGWGKQSFQLTDAVYFFSMDATDVQGCCQKLLSCNASRLLHWKSEEACFLSQLLHLQSHFSGCFKVICSRWQAKHLHWFSSTRLPRILTLSSVNVTGLHHLMHNSLWERTNEEKAKLPFQHDTLWGSKISGMRAQTIF